VFTWYNLDDAGEPGMIHYM